MKNNSTELVVLFDLYGAVLTDKQRELFDLYHNEDLSLSEIAENEGISRQGVRDTLIRAENQLLDLERRLGLHRRFGGVEAALSAIGEAARDIKELNAKSLYSVALDDKARFIIETIRNLSGE